MKRIGINLPDRELTEKETKKFVEESSSGDIFNALEVFQEENTKPTLHDLCIIELNASLVTIREVLIQQGREINLLKKTLKEFEGYV